MDRLIFQSEQPIVVIGDVMLDRYWTGNCMRISPEAPVPVVNFQHAQQRAGGAGNVALNIASLGLSSVLHGIVGQDEQAQTLATLLEQAHVDCRFSVDPSKPTITKLRILSSNQQILRVDFEQPFSENAALFEQAASSLQNASAVIFSDYNKGTLAQIQAMIQYAKQLQLPILVDPKGDNFSKYHGATLLTPNMKEFEAVVGPCSSESEIKTKALALIQQCDLQALLLTRSEQGMSLISKDGQMQHFSAIVKDVADVTGAGDTVIATLASALVSNYSLAAAAEIANIAASIVVGKVGTEQATPSEINQAAQVQQLNNQQHTFYQAELLAEHIALAKHRGERIVFTNGCFDILHPGHISYLNEAKRLGHKLVVGVNSDASIKRLKGEDRPINDLAHRMAVLVGLQAVDWVVAFEEDTPLELIKCLQPDVLVKGGDYTLDTIVGAKEVLANGGEVLALNFENGFSTTQIINSIKKSAP